MSFYTHNFMLNFKENWNTIYFCRQLKGGLALLAKIGLFYRMKWSLTICGGLSDFAATLTIPAYSSPNVCLFDKEVTE